VAKVEREKTVIQFRQSVLTAVGEVSDALVKIEKLKAQQNIAVNRVKTLEQATANSNLLLTGEYRNAANAPGFPYRVRRMKLSVPIKRDGQFHDVSAVNGQFPRPLNRTFLR
jgi:hypothetical protein